MAQSASHKQTQKNTPVFSSEIRKRFLTKKDILPIFVVVTVSLILNLVGFGWGMDGQVPWAADGIEGITTVREMPKLFDKWTYKYPRLQFLVDGLCYKPWIQHWEENPAYSSVNGRQQKQTLTLERLNTLAIISRINILLMSSLIILFIYLIARFYYANSISAFFASLSLAVCFIFVYYSHTTCVDIPSTLWITLGVYCLLRSVYLNTMTGHLLMGLFFAFAACTKDAMFFYAAAFSIVYVAMRTHHLYREGLPFKKCLLSLINRNTVLAVVLFLFTFALLQNILISPKAYWERMGVWIGGRGVKDFNQNFKGQWHLLWTTLQMFHWSIGWPLIALTLISLVYTSRKHLFFNILAVLFPLVFFYVLVSMRIKMSFIRYYLPIMGLLFLPVGAMVSEFFTLRKKGMFRLCMSLVSGVFVLSILFCIALDCELINDTRNQAADWFKAHVKENTPVLSLVNRPYGPKLTEQGYPMIENWKVPPLELLLRNKQQLPDYLVLSEQWYTIRSDEAKTFRQALLNGQGGYTNVIQLGSKGFLIPKKNALSIACWPLKPNLAISPPIIVMKKDTAK